MWLWVFSRAMAQFGKKEGVPRLLHTRYKSESWVVQEIDEDMSRSYTPTEICALRSVAHHNITSAALKCGCKVRQAPDGSYRPNCSSELAEIELGNECGIGGDPDDQRFHDCRDWRQALLRWQPASGGLIDIENLVKKLVHRGTREIMFIGDSVMKQTVAAFICATKRAHRLLKGALFSSIVMIDVKNISGVRDMRQQERLRKLRQDRQLTALYTLNLHTTTDYIQLLVIFSNFIPQGGLKR